MSAAQPVGDSQPQNPPAAGGQTVTPLPPIVVQAPRPPRRTPPVPVQTATPTPPEPGNAPGVIMSNGYVTNSGRTATKTDTLLLETPQAVSTVTQKQIEERKPQTLLEALNYTPGARVGSYGFDPRYDSFSVRGIDMTYTGVFRDGLRQLNSPNGLFRLEPYGLEAISVLRGPAATLYGASSTGGIVDLISKRPMERPFREVELQTGSFSRKQSAFDLSGPVEGNDNVLYRVTALVRDASSTISAVKDDRVFIAPAFTFKITPDTKITFLSEYMNSVTGGTAAYFNNYRLEGGVFRSIGATRIFGGDARYNDFTQNQGRVGYELEHRFNDAFTFHQNLRYSALQTNQEYIFGGSGLVRERNSGFVADNYLESLLRTGGAEHRVLTGVDYSYLNYTSRQVSRLHFRSASIRRSPTARHRTKL